jgi:hypothetical protein
MDATNAWRMLFATWPESVPRQGLIVTKFQESIPFLQFRASDAILLVDRGKPDAAGARKVMVAFEQIAAVKVAGTQEMSAYEVLGFH